MLFSLLYDQSTRKSGSKLVLFEDQFKTLRDINLKCSSVPELNDWYSEMNLPLQFLTELEFSLPLLLFQNCGLS